MVTVNDSSIGKVLIVDDEPSSRKILALILEEAGIRCEVASNAEEALGILERHSFDIVISDLQMTGMSGMELLREVRQRYPGLTFLMVTGVDDVRVGIQAIQQGADDYLVKPLQMDLVTFSLQRAVQRRRLQTEVEKYRVHLEELVAERTQQLQAAVRQVERSYDHTLEVLGEAIDLRDSQTAGHSHRVCLYSVKILAAMGGTERELRSVAMGAWLHDIGKLAIPDAILLKPGALTDEERRIMQLHVPIGYELVKRMPFLTDVAEIILMHHERCDGTGYPQGLKTVDIHLGAKVFAVADTIDAMTSNRPYRKALPFKAAREQIESGSGTQYDFEVASAFLSIPAETWERVREQTAVETSAGQKIREALVSINGG